MSCVLEVIQEIAMTFSTQTYYSVGWYQLFYFQYMIKAVANGPVGQVLARTLFLKVITKFNFTKSKQ